MFDLSSRLCRAVGTKAEVPRRAKPDVGSSLASVVANRYAYFKLASFTFGVPRLKEKLGIN